MRVILQPGEHRITRHLKCPLACATLGMMGVRKTREMAMLIQWLRDRQRAEGVTDLVFASRMGMLRGHWTQIRLGIRKANSLRVLQGALAAYPEHREEIIHMIEIVPTEAED